MRRAALTCLFAAVVGLAGSCGGGPNIGPTPPPGGGNGGGGGGGGGNPNPPANSQPVIETITVQGTRPGQPANFADLGESIAVSGKVRDAETPIDQLVYTWTATTGTFTGTGANVTWQAPATAPVAVEGLTPATVTITLTITEKFGHPGQPLSFEQSVWTTTSVALHDSVKEVGDMSRQFLLDFSDTNIKDANYILRNFGSTSFCPDPQAVIDERFDVTRNFTEYRMTNFGIGQAATTVSFGGRCPVFGSRGDACAVVPVFWDSIEIKTGKRSFSSGNDIIAAAYSTSEKRWWLCASNYQIFTVIGARPAMR
jgi:hypothetical protein